ncbi:KH domain-containing protein SPIN1 [Trichinella pseudospiralis]|uniref:KH domain-containing protein SPIN1 n=1 Tax=Trichinella pseudospiralis TaxID=6337 RepID=A0A0V0XVV8_TRIPS|nr:KH domain-containing protein SPIN1 [Trichinella pseudospiralis]
MNSKGRFYERWMQNERLAEVLRNQQSGNTEHDVLQHCIKETFTLPLFADMPSPPPPTGEVEDKCFMLPIPKSGYPFDVALRIIGPRGSTVKAVQGATGCKIVLYRGNPDLVRVHISATDYANIAAWRIEQAKRLIMALVEIPQAGQDTIKKLQLAELAVYKGNFTNRLQPLTVPQNNSRFVGNASRGKQQYSQSAIFKETNGMRRRFH